MRGLPKGRTVVQCRWCGCEIGIPVCRVGLVRSCVRCASASFDEKFWRRVGKSEGCWEWQGSRHPQGHGYATPPGTRRVSYAHRVAWIITNGPIPDGLEVCHKCDNPPCVRPDHLFLGTHKDNMHDAISKGRHRNGERCKQSKLTEADVRLLRQHRASGGSVRALAREMGWNYSAARNAANGTNWKHVA